MWTCRPSMMFSSTVMCRNSSMFWNVRAMPRRAIVPGLVRTRLRSPRFPLWKTISPTWGRYRPLMQLRRLVFPAPLGPMMAWMSPWETLKVTPSRARTPPNRSVMSLISICTAPAWSVLPFRLCR